jgi:hypothetical protein
MMDSIIPDHPIVSYLAYINIEHRKRICRSRLVEVGERHGLAHTEMGNEELTQHSRTSN